MIRPSQRFELLLMAVVAAAGVLAGSPARAWVYGEAELGYESYNSRYNGTSNDASTFRQRYMALFGRSGLLEYGRLGTYRYSLGYEWASFDTRVKGTGETATFSVNAGHLLYDGFIDVRPVNLPFHLKAYSRDLSRIKYTEDYSTNFLIGDPILRSDITTSLDNGTHMRSGVYLTYGLKNDMFNPFYRELPLFTIDYTDDYDKDSKSLTATDMRLKRLGVMLTKGDVELSFWRRDFQDRVNPGSSYIDDIYTLGTVSYREGRKFVDLTNWIKLSADASFHRQKQFGDGGDSTDDYEFNLHGIASRDRWEVTTFNYLARSMNRAGESYNVRVPVYARGTWSADTDWQLRLTAMDQTTKGFVARDDQKSVDLLASARVNTFKRSPFTLSPSLSVEQVEDLKQRSVLVVGSVETASNRRFSDRYALFGSYTVSLANTESLDSTSTSSYVQHVLQGRGVYRVSDALRVEAQETLKVGSGTNESSGGGILGENFNTNRPVPGSTGAAEISTSGYYQSVTKFTSSWIPSPRMRVGVIVTEDILQRTDQEMDMLTSVANTVEYSLPSFAIGSSIQFAKRTYNEGDSSEISGSGSARYAPDKTMSADLRYTFSHVNENGSVTDNVDVSQLFRYSFFTASGYGRNWLNLREELTWIRNGATTPGQPTSLNSRRRLTLGADYFPTRNMFVSATIRYSLLEPENADELLGSAGIGLRFKKFQADINYSYGKRNGDTDNRVEQRVSANVRKQF